MIYDLQKPSFMKRIAAFMLDFFLIVILATGFAFLLSLIVNFDGALDKYQTLIAQYETTYGLKYSLTNSEIAALTSSEISAYEEMFKAMNSDSALLKAYSTVFNLSLIIITFGVLISVVVVEFIVPLILKNGQTVGKKLFSLCVINLNSVRITKVQLFIRSILGVYVIELMIPALVIIMLLFGMMGGIGAVVLFGLLILEIVILIANKNHVLIHDVLSGTAVADKSTQMIFENADKLIKYQQKLHEDEVKRTKTY